MANQTLKDNSSNPTTIAWEKYLITADYLIRNPKKIKNGWDYRRIETFLKFIVANSGIKPDFDLEKASLQEVVNFLRSHSDAFPEVEEHLESVVPSPELLKQLLEDWEKAQTKFSQERAAEKIAKIAEQVTVSKKWQGIIEKRLTERISSEITERIVNFAVDSPVDTNPELKVKKAESLSGKQKEILLYEVAGDVQGVLQKHISTAIKLLENVPEKEKEILLAVKVSPDDLPILAFELGQPANQREKTKRWLTAQLTPFTEEEAKKIIEIVTPAVLAKIELYPKTIVKFSGQQFSDFQIQIEEAFIVSLAETAPELGTIPSEKISKIISAFIPQNKEELKLWVSAKEGNPAIILDEAIEVTSLLSKWPRFFTSPLQRSSPNDTLRVKDKGKTIIEQLRQRIFSEGINKNNALFLRSIVLENWALCLTAQNISQEDLDYTIKRLTKSGENPNSFRIKELREIKEALVDFQASLPPQKLQEIKETGKKLGQQGSSPVSLNSRSRTIILREKSFNPKFNLKTKFYTFLNRFLGKKSVVLDSGPTVVINRLTLFTHRVSEGFKTIFFQTGIGQNIGSWLQISTRKGLQGIWDLTRAGGGKIITEGFKPLFGLGTKKGLSIIGEMGAMALSGGLSKVFTLGRGLIKGISSGIGIFKTILGGISGESSETDNSLIKQILLVVVGIFIIIPVLFFLINTTTSTAFIEPTEISLGEIPLPVMVPLQCNSPRHLSEETICKLSQNPPPCNNEKINQITWNSVDQCFQQITLPNKQAIYDEFKSSVQTYHSLQCVGFTQGIQKALAKEIIKNVKKARDYLYEPYPPNYEFIRGEGAKPEKGDLSIWYGNENGHIAIVVEVVGNIKIIVAQAWGDDTGAAGNIFLSESPYGGVSDGSPNGFLRPK